MQIQFTRTQLIAFVSMLILSDVVLVSVIVGSQVSPTMGIVAGAAGILIPLALFTLVVPLAAGAMGWFTLHRLYPQVGTPVFRSDAPMISPAFGSPWVGLNNVTEAYADEEHLHMRLFSLTKRSRMPVSIPWARVVAIEPFKKDRAILRLETGPSIYVPKRLVAAEMALRASLDDSEMAPK